MIFTLLTGYLTFAQKAPVKVDEGYQVEIKTSAICDMCKETLEYDLAFEKGVKEAILNRKSIRKYLDKQVEKEKRELLCSTPFTNSTLIGLTHRCTLSS